VLNFSRIPIPTQADQVTEAHLNILLFDVDGVLIDDRGYRAGVVATINHFAALMGCGNCAPSVAHIEAFHAHGYTNEWDICPLAIGALVLSALRAQPDFELAPAPLEAFLAQFRSISVAPIDYAAWVAATRDRPGHPAARALAMLNEALAQLPVAEATRAAVAAALAELLRDPYDFPQAKITQVFQEYVLGSSLFEEVYRLRPRFDAPSFLYDEDRAALSASARTTLLDLVAAGAASVCVYTARPSLPPSDIVNWLADGAHAPLGFSPEAELALQRIELGEVPLIAMGRMQWLAEQVGTKVEYLTKPAPVQALAAILAAVSRREAEALRAAYRLLSEGELSGALTQLVGRSLEVWVVEDATLGVHAALGAIDLLRKHAIDVRLRAVGVSNPGPKADALLSVCEVVLPSVNAAIAYVADCIRAQSSASTDVQSPALASEGRHQPPSPRVGGFREMPPTGSNSPL